MAFDTGHLVLIIFDSGLGFNLLAGRLPQGLRPIALGAGARTSAVRSLRVWRSLHRYEVFALAQKDLCFINLRMFQKATGRRRLCVSSEVFGADLARLLQDFRCNCEAVAVEVQFSSREVGATLFPPRLLANPRTRKLGRAP